MMTRHIESTIRSIASEYPIIFLTGPRQSGKTTLSKKLFPKLPYVLLEDLDEREFAISDPKGFLARFKKGAIIDEAQHAPQLFSYLMGIVDADNNAKFILTGSQNFLLHNKISQSLAGRVGIAHLMPLSIAELKNARQLPQSVEEMMYTGGYPRIYDKKIDPGLWYKNYFNTYVERDVRTLTNIGDLNTFQRFVRLCASHSGQLVNLSALAADIGITQPTAKAWLSVLEASFILILLSPHNRNFRKRLVKSQKLYFLDTGLLCYLLSIGDEKSLYTHALRGPIFETLIVSELYKSFQNNGKDPSLFFWRDHTGHEVDVLIDTEKTLKPLEIKSGQTIAQDAFKGLFYWLNLPKNTKKGGYLIYGGEKTYTRQGIQVLPWDRTDEMLS